QQQRSAAHPVAFVDGDGRDRGAVRDADLAPFRRLEAAVAEHAHQQVGAHHRRKGHGHGAAPPGDDAGRDADRRDQAQEGEDVPLPRPPPRRTAENARRGPVDAQNPTVMPTRSSRGSLRRRGWPKVGLVWMTLSAWNPSSFKNGLTPITVWWLKTRNRSRMKSIRTGPAA